VLREQFGFGMTVVILLDATVVRSVLVLAMMKLLGDRNWHLADFLGRMATKPSPLRSPTWLQLPRHPAQTNHRTGQRVVPHPPMRGWLFL